MIDPAQKRRDSEPLEENTSNFCRLKFTVKQNYRIDRALEDFHTIEDLAQMTGCSIKRVKSHIKYIENNCPHAKREFMNDNVNDKFRFVLK